MVLRNIMLIPIQKNVSDKQPSAWRNCTSLAIQVRSHQRSGCLSYRLSSPESSINGSLCDWLPIPKSRSGGCHSYLCRPITRVPDTTSITSEHNMTADSPTMSEELRQRQFGPAVSATNCDYVKEPGAVGSMSQLWSSKLRRSYNSYISNSLLTYG